MHEFKTADGHTVWWYPRMGCVLFDGRLSFLADACHICLAGVVQRGSNVVAEAGIESDAQFLRERAQWPTSRYWSCVKFRELLADGRDWFCVVCHTSQERVALSMMGLFIDEVHPAFRRLQRWFRKYSRRSTRERTDRQLAFAMATHFRLGSCSFASMLVPDVMEAVLQRL